MINLLASTKSINEISKYQFMREADEGSGGFLDGSYLIPYPREDADDYKNRREYTSYANYIKPIISALVDPVFSKPPVREYLDSSGLQKDFVSDVTGGGVDMTTFIRRVARNARRSGIAYVVVDNIKKSEQPVNLKVVKDLRKYPYVYSVDAEDVVYASVDKYGSLNKIIYKEYYINDSGKNATRYRLWGVGVTSLFEEFENGEPKKLIETIELDIDAIPVIDMHGTDSSDGIFPNPPLYDLARMNHTIYQLDSYIMEQIRKCTFGMLGVPVENTRSIESALQIGASNALYFDKNGAPPLWIEPSGSSLISIREERASKVTEMYRIANLSSVTGVQNQQSGVAKEWDFRALNSALMFLAGECERVEYKMLELFAKYTGEKASTVAIEYNRAFGVEDVLSVIEQAQSALNLGIGGEFDKQIKIKIAGQLFRGDLEKVKEIQDSINSMKSDEEHANNLNEGVSHEPSAD